MKNNTTLSEQCQKSNRKISLSFKATHTTLHNILLSVN